MTDAAGRVLIVHGVNVPSKWLPAYPSALAFDGSHAAFLASLGFNAIRVTAERYALEPTPGDFDASYVNQLASTVATLHSSGILSLVDFHQDEYGPVFNDNGYPDWMTVTDGLPNKSNVGFPLQYLLNPALNRAFDHLWANDPDQTGNQLQADDAAILSYVATSLGSHSGILGYEIINEPWPGSRYPGCLLSRGCRAFDEGPFSAYYQRLIPALRAADQSHLIWYEPLSTFNSGVPTYVNPPADTERGFAFHDYSLCSCQRQDAKVLSNAIARSTATGDALLETEFGATTKTSTLTRLVNLYDRSMMPWMFWSYTRYMVALAADGSLLPPAIGNVNQRIVNVLARPYPQLVSGTPLSWSFDPSSRIFRMRYSTLRADGGGAFAAGSVTYVAVPAIQYPSGYAVTVRGGAVQSAPDAALLEIASSPGASVVLVTVSRGP